MADSQELEPSTSKANPYNAGRQNHQEIEKNISQKGMQRKCTRTMLLVCGIISHDQKWSPTWLPSMRILPQK
jgi:DNA-directed RNA polymerase subunit N (RpoN/RPB10)